MNESDDVALENFAGITWLSVPDFADRLGTSAANVRGALKDRRIVAMQASHRVGPQIPEQFLVPAHLANAAAPKPAPEPGEEKLVILPSLRGTITVLGDGGLTDHEILAWLFTDHPYLGSTPLDTLRLGNKSAVRRAALVLD